jgi:hypothetical protein
VAKQVTLDLEGRSSDSISGTLEVLNSSKTLIKSYSFTTSAAGLASINIDNTSGPLYFRLKAVPYLTRIISGDMNSALIFSQLKVGDINGDNIINSIDFSSLNTRWFQADSSRDLNLDGIINSLDFSLMNKNWFARGEE